MSNLKVIFDLGMHRGKDSQFYLKKGFSVVALECNPALASMACAQLGDYVKSGQLTIVEKALWEGDEQDISFFVNPEKDDWSSVFKRWAEKEGHSSSEIRVKTVSLSSLFDAHGVPYYIKCDIEGADELFAKQLLRDSRRPKYVSVEAMSFDILAYLRAAGYDRFQIVNQMNNSRTKSPSPALEGVYVEQKFDGHMSGLFGEELPSDKWMTFEVASQTFLDMRRVRARDANLVLGWFDFHARYPSD